jgi:cyclopropane-fatty-acyl-phospholipid synthase
MIGLPRTISARRAAGILRQVFERIPTGFAFRLWDGTSVEVGHGAPVVTAVIREPATFIRLVRDPSPLNFAEAYVEGALDIEGDLFAGMKVADAMEDIRLSTVDRLRLVVSLWRD